MKKLVVIIAMLILGLHSTSSWAESLFNILTQNNSVVTDLRTDEENVWIKLASEHTSEPITVRISDKNKDFYRPWFHGNVDLVSTGFRGNNVWSDRVQTKAKYVEYWLNDELVLHLERK